MGRVESEPIRLTFNADVLAKKRAAHAAFIAARDKEQDELWAQIRADREARKTREAGRWSDAR